MSFLNKVIVLQRDSKGRASLVDLSNLTLDENIKFHKAIKSGKFKFNPNGGIVDNKVLKQNNSALDDPFGEPLDFKVDF